MTSAATNHLCIIVASQQPNSQSRRIANHINTVFLNNKADIIDLYEQQLPLWDSSAPTDVVKQVKAQATKADAFVVIAPEWNGMAPAALKNFFLWCSGSELGHKPALLVAISSGVGGGMVISELRASSYKNSRIVYLPDHLIFRDVTKLWNNVEGYRSDEYLHNRTAYSLEVLNTYASALKPVRASLIADFSTYPNGMS